jgi:hypothetical protein
MFGLVWELKTPLIFRLDYVLAVVEFMEPFELGADGSLELTYVRVLRYLWLVLLGKRCSGMRFPLKPFRPRSA